VERRAGLKLKACVGSHRKARKSEQPGL